MKLGIAGINTRPLMGIVDREVIAGRSTARENVAIGAQRLGDQAGAEGWQHACMLLDYTYVACPDRNRGGMRYRPAFTTTCSPLTRPLPLYLDSASYREWSGGAPAWSDYERYCQAIDLVQPDGAMAKDVFGDQRSSYAAYQRMCADGYRGITIPVWHVMPAWDRTLTAAANAVEAARQPILREYCTVAPLVAIGGLLGSPVSRTERARYIEVLCRLFPDTQFWGLGQANPAAVNHLGCAGLLQRVWLDGSWFIHDARAEVMAVLEDGLIKVIRLTRTGARSFFPLLDLMGCNLRSLLAAYAGLWSFPGPAKVPTDLDDLEARLEMRRRLAGSQLGLFCGLGAS